MDGGDQEGRSEGGGQGGGPGPGEVVHLCPSAAWSTAGVEARRSLRRCRRRRGPRSSGASATRTTRWPRWSSCSAAEPSRSWPTCARTRGRGSTRSSTDGRSSQRLMADGIGYVWLGDDLGGRPAEPELHDRDGKVDYAAVAATERFHVGIDRLLDLAAASAGGDAVQRGRSDGLPSPRARDPRAARAGSRGDPPAGRRHRDLGGRTWRRRSRRLGRRRSSDRRVSARARIVTVTPPHHDGRHVPHVRRKRPR